MMTRAFREVAEEVALPEAMDFLPRRGVRGSLVGLAARFLHRIPQRRIARRRAYRCSETEQ